jgi:hypothetical protein
MQVFRSFVVTVLALCIAGCARTICVHDGTGKPVEGAKVTIISDKGTQSSLTGKDGVATIASHAGTKGTIIIEKDGYHSKKYAEDGSDSLVDFIEPIRN